MSRIRTNAVGNKLFWAWVAVEVGAAAWFGWQIAKAEAQPWARKRRSR